MPTEGATEAQLFWSFWGFLVLLAGAIVISLVTTWVVRKVFPPRGCPNGNGSHKSNGKMEALTAELLVESRKQTAVLEAEDPDGCKKVHNKPSVEKLIRETWERVKALAKNGRG